MLSVVRNMKIKHKLTTIIMLTCIIALLSNGAIFVVLRWIDEHHNMVLSLSTQAKIIADNCKAAITFDDAEDAKETLSSLQVESTIVFGCVYKGDGKIFASYYRYGTDKRIQPSKFKQERYNFSDGFLTVFEKIVLDGEIIGVVCLRVDLEPMYLALRRSIKTIVYILLVVSLLAYLISCGLQSIISKPILSLTELARDVSEKNDYSVRGIKQSNDEIGLLIDAFNEMITQIQKRDLALVKTNRQLEDKVKERTADLTAMVEKLNQSNQQLQEFTYVASHDLREPVRKISSFGKLLASSLANKLSDDERENLDFMIDGANRMQQMIEALLVYSRVTTKGVEFEDVDLNEVVEQLKSLELSVTLEETSGNILIPERLPLVRSDLVQVRQLLQNLIANGLKYHKKDVLPEVTIRAHGEDDGMVRIEVQDNGIGIKREQHDNVFIMFRRLHSKTEYKGAGIGLAVCKKIVERHGGKIGVESTYGQGSTFWFTIPAVKAVKEQIMSIASIEN